MLSAYLGVLCIEQTLTAETAEMDQQNPDSRMVVQMLDLPGFRNSFDCDFTRNCDLIDQ